MPHGDILLLPFTAIRRQAPPESILHHDGHHHLPCLKHASILRCKVGPKGQRTRFLTQSYPKLSATWHPFNKMTPETCCVSSASHFAFERSWPLDGKQQMTECSPQIAFWRDDASSRQKPGTAAVRRYAHRSGELEPENSRKLSTGGLSLLRKWVGWIHHSWCSPPSPNERPSTGPPFLFLLGMVLAAARSWESESLEGQSGVVFFGWVTGSRERSSHDAGAPIEPLSVFRLFFRPVTTSPLVLQIGVFVAGRMISRRPYKPTTKHRTNYPRQQRARFR